MSWISTITKAVTGTAAAAAAITALPILGGVGAITAIGSGVAATIGTGAAIADKVSEDRKKNS